MRAYRMTGPGRAGLVDLPDPEPGPGEVRLDVSAAGLCHSDLAVLAGSAGSGWPLPMTLGHEICGRVAALGEGVAEVVVGDQVVVHAPIGCGACDRCRCGRTNYCDRRAAVPVAGIGLGTDGGMADAVVVGADHLVAADGLDPASAAALTDAGLTSYHAIGTCRASLDRPGSVAVVLGVGGLGHLAIRILRATTGARIVALDTRDDALDLARRCGADAVARPAEAAEVVAEVSDGRGADAVLDFVAAPRTVELAATLLRTAGELVYVGAGGGVLAVTKPGPLPFGGCLRLPFWGSRPELEEVVGLALAGSLDVETVPFPLVAADEAVARLREGRIVGRAVLLPADG
ncbi:alcohol dehydrogenase catalytic domain-containing protein [Pseudonocardia sp. ICBG162]|uniref:alcohol dehydrogenase catalytic domain-containing protein n=1 Tax=Pseudonocardia sp. ICBG162 TaxID=2846761 RepID=UPI001CF6DED0|nr:alcohol dehydrogenase catalytic domain-containing protein [Pseudonocardia sp. ICBG162]